MRVRGTVLVAAALAAASLVSCAPAPAAPACVRHDLVSMGPENGFRIRVAAESAPALDGETDVLDLAITLVPPVAGPLRLVHAAEGRAVESWDLAVGGVSGISTRCRLAATKSQSTCRATLAALPFSTAGEWSIEAGENTVLEAGLAVRSCR